MSTEPSNGSKGLVTAQPPSVTAQVERQIAQHALQIIFGLAELMVPGDLFRCYSGADNQFMHVTTT